MSMGARPLNNKGMSLMEMIVMIVVLGVAIPVLMRMWADVSWRSVHAELTADGLFYAQSLLEEAKCKRFDENTGVPWTSSANFSAADSGENKNNKDTFDDVDDFVGATDPKVTTPAAKFVRSVAVSYARPSGATWQACGAVTCTNTTDCTQCNACCYKHIRVSVSRTDNTVKDLSLETIVSAY